MISCFFYTFRGGRRCIRGAYPGRVCPGVCELHLPGAGSERAGRQPRQPQHHCQRQVRREPSSQVNTENPNQLYSLSHARNCSLCQNAGVDFTAFLSWSQCCGAGAGAGVAVIKLPRGAGSRNYELRLRLQSRLRILTILSEDLKKFYRKDMGCINPRKKVGTQSQRR